MTPLWNWDAGNCAGMKTTPCTWTGFPPDSASRNLRPPSFFFWRPTQLDRVYPVGDGQALWIRFVLAPRSEREHWYLEFPFANLDRATLYARGADGTWQSRTAGDHVPVVDWPVPGRQPVLPLTLSSTQPTEHLLRIEHAFATSVPMMLTNEQQVLMRERVVTMGLGIYFGITLLGCVIALAAAVWMRDLASALFVPPTLLLGLSAASFAGINGWLLWPRHAAWNDLCRPLPCPRWRW